MFIRRRRKKGKRHFPLGTKRKSFNKRRAWAKLCNSTERTLCPFFFFFFFFFSEEIQSMLGWPGGNKVCERVLFYNFGRSFFFFYDERDVFHLRKGRRRDVIGEKSFPLGERDSKKEKGRAGNFRLLKKKKSRFEIVAVDWAAALHFQRSHRHVCVFNSAWLTQSCFFFGKWRLVSPQGRDEDRERGFSSFWYRKCIGPRK